ncbi:MAG: MBL fold metallo-hydrolase [Stappia sp.]|uniref:MBL fold metallo-hydrolase n=1 Tax=Stappia sp. TaxID=1870903 RepID=UPI000C400EB2|nr:MBL fold metallo-hydrolase [Stappia sp.]MAA98461.1 MBL fold metallo-hydrolase [Stappia sp.]MBM19123.1 MBL fold metallo-hydrolase [Stappia sp.]MBM20195.1 MBL fold metallo-hydrolase [Stappia sp.]
MARLTCVSGINGKLPAAFLLETAGARLLLDLGEGPEPGVLPDLTGVGEVDAILISHAHQDHCGGLDLAARLGNPPVHATATTFRLIEAEYGAGFIPGDRRRLLPESGPATVCGVPLTLGRSGHAPGGVWIHADAAGGILYTGDWSRESTLLPFDSPPPARVLVTDASYGDRDEPLADQIEHIAREASSGAVLPVPAGGRGPEVALALEARGLAPRPCPRLVAELRDIADGRVAGVSARIARAAARLADATAGRTDDWHPSDVIVAAGSNAETGLPADLLARIGEGFRFIFSSHVPKGTPAHDLLRTDRARWFAWNVHPCLSDTLALARETGAEHVLPVFAARETMTGLCTALGERLVLDPVLDLGPSRPAERTGSRAS